MTDRDIVLAAYPNAVAVKSELWHIVVGGAGWPGAETEAGAWDIAAQALQTATGHR